MENKTLKFQRFYGVKIRDFSDFAPFYEKRRKYGKFTKISTSI